MWPFSLKMSAHMPLKLAHLTHCSHTCFIYLLIKLTCVVTFSRWSISQARSCLLHAGSSIIRLQSSDSLAAISFTAPASSNLARSSDVSIGSGSSLCYQWNYIEVTNQAASYSNTYDLYSGSACLNVSQHTAYTWCFLCLPWVLPDKCWYYIIHRLQLFPFTSRTIHCSLLSDRSLVT